MASRRRVRAVTGGKRVGTKRRDMRWESPDGQIWDSRFEWEVYDVLRHTAEGRLRRTEPGTRDTFSYSVPVRNATCDGCGATKVSKRRKFTADLFQDGAGDVGKEGGYYLEIKGYLRASQRSLLRAFCKARRDIALRIIYQKDFKVSAALTVTQWTARFLKIPFAVWDGKTPIKWRTV